MSVVSPHSLIGKPEAHDLEFKSAEILKKPAAIAREVVAFLNADGGSVWIGIGERNGAAFSLETIPSPDASKDSLRDHLLDVIEPAPTNDEVQVEVKEGLIRVSVSKGKRGPYALLKEKGRQYILRVGARVREMTRDEVACAFRRPDMVKSGTSSSGAAAKVQAGMDTELKSGKDRLWWRIALSPPLQIDFENADRSTKKFFDDLLTNPAASGNRRNGWTMVLFHNSLPKLTTDRVSHRFGEGDKEHGIDILRDGTMTFWAPRVRLDRDWDSEGSTIFPLALLELPVSSFRIASKVLDKFGSAADTASCGAVFGGMNGAILRPGSPNGPMLPWKPPVSFDSSALVVDPFETTKQEIVSKPDAAAYRLVRRIYEQFGLVESDIPAEFDRNDHTLRLPT